MKKYNLVLKLFIGVLLFSTGMLFNRGQASCAAVPTPLQIDTVDYEEEEIVVNNNSNTKIFFATEIEASKDNWEVMPIDDSTDNKTRIDFSWLSPTTENILKVKGDDDTYPATVYIPERTRKLDISINYSNMESLVIPPNTAANTSIAPLLNIMSSAGTADDPINYGDLEWRKGESGKWKDISELTVAQVEKYQIKGVDLYFRITAVNDVTVTNPSYTIYPDGSRGRRASSEIKLKINKKSPPMVVGIDGEDYTAEIKYGQEYRVTIGSDTTDWIRVTDRAVRDIPLKTFISDVNKINAADIIADGLTYPFPGMFLEIRDYSTAKAPSSKITEISLNPQRPIGGTIIKGDVPVNPTPAEKKNVYLKYNGTSNITLTIPMASTTLPYEYCIVKPGVTDPELEWVSWSAITKNTPVKILGSKAVDGGILYVRQKEIKSRTATRTTPAVAYELASTYASKQLKYPSIPEVEDKTITFVKGYPDTCDLTFTVKLNKDNKEPYETAIKNIKLGTMTVKYVEPVVISPVLGNPIDSTQNYVMTVTLDKETLASLTNCYARPLIITFGNGTVDKTSVKVTIKNPTPALLLTATPAKGTALNTTAVNVTSTVGTGNELIYTFGSTLVENKNTEEVIPAGTGLPFTSGANINITGSYLTVYEIDSATRHIVKYRSIQITPEYTGS